MGVQVNIAFHHPACRVDEEGDALGKFHHAQVYQGLVVAGHLAVGIGKQHLRGAVSHPLTVMDEKKSRQLFRPRLGLGVVTLDPEGVNPMDVLNDAERHALAKVLMPSRLMENDIETVPMQLS